MDFSLEKILACGWIKNIYPPGEAAPWEEDEDYILRPRPISELYRDRVYN